MDDKNFTEGMAALIEIFGGEMSELKFAIYREICGEMSNGSWQHVIKTAISECQFFPRPAGLKKFESEYFQQERYCRILETPQLPAPPPPPIIPLSVRIKTVREQIQANPNIAEIFNTILADMEKRYEQHGDNVQ